MNIEVTDGRGGIGAQSYQLVVSDTIPNLPPVITSSPSFVAAVGQPYSYPVAARDPDGDTLQFSLLAGPSGMIVSGTAGLVEWTPTAAQVGLQQVQLVARDPDGLGCVQTYSINVRAANHAPVIDSQPVLQVSAGATYRYDVRARDLDGDPLSYSLSTSPAGMTIDRLGRIAWPVAPGETGSRHVEVVVTDAPRGILGSNPSTSRSRPISRRRRSAYR